MRFVFFLFVFLGLNTVSCQVVTNRDIEERQVVCSLPSFPFLLRGVSPSIVLPKSFQIGKNGRAVVYLFLNDQGIKEGFSIVLLDWGKEDRKKFYEFSNSPKASAKYPPDVQPFVSFFQKEIAKIKIQKKKGARIKKGKKYYYAIVYDLEKPM